MSRLKRVNHSLTDQLGHEPTDLELGSRVNMPANKVAQFRALGLSTTSRRAMRRGSTGQGAELRDLIGGMLTRLPIRDPSAHGQADPSGYD